VSFVSDPSNCIQQGFDFAEHLPSKGQQAPLEIAEARFRLAMDAAIPDTGQKHPSAAKLYNNIHKPSGSMSERATTRMFGLSLGGILLATLILHAVLR
jgi:hypothetical protein